MTAQAGTVDANNGGISTGQISVGTSATLIATGRVGRRAITIVNEGTTAVRLGSSAVTTGNGVLLPGAVGASFTLEGAEPVYGIVGSGTQAVSYVETF